MATTRGDVSEGAPEAPSPYAILGVPPTATDSQIRRAYLVAVRRHHPDMHPDMGGNAGDDGFFHSVASAYETLRDPGRRQAYDEVQRAKQPRQDSAEPRAWHPPVDDDVVEPPAPPPPPPPPPPRPPRPPRRVPRMPRARPSRAPRHRAQPVRCPRDLLPWLLAAAAAGLVVAVATRAWTSGSILTMIVGLVAGLAIGLVLHSHPALRSRHPVMAALAVPVMAAAAPAGAIAPLVQGAVLGWALIGPACWVCREQVRLDRVAARSDLQSGQVLGSCPDGVAVDVLDQLCRQACPATVRLVRGSSSVFTHAIVSGRRVALLTALIAPAGDYSWSGRSLVRLPTGAGWPVEVHRGTHADVARRLRQTLGSRARVRSFLLVVPPGGAGRVHGRDSSGMPGILGADDFDQVAQFLRDGHVPGRWGNRRPAVEQRVVCQVMSAVQ